MEWLKDRAQMHARLSAMVVSAASVLLPIAVLDSNAVGQCAGYSVEVFAGPDCPIFPSFATAWGIAENGAICGAYMWTVARRVMR
jgi:hypothetical protein